MSLTGVIARFSTGTYTVTRTDAALFDTDTGYAVPGAQVVFTIDACVQPEGRALKQPAEGQHAEDVMRVYTTTALQTRTPSTAPDRIAIDGEAFEVFHVQLWRAFGEVFYRARVSRVVVP